MLVISEQSVFTNLAAEHNFSGANSLSVTSEGGKGMGR